MSPAHDATSATPALTAAPPSRGAARFGRVVAPAHVGRSVPAALPDLPALLDLRVRVRRATGARPDRPTLRRVCENVLRGEAVAGPASLTLAIVGDDEIHAINRRFRGVDRPTDVLSFSLVDAATETHGETRGFVTPADQPTELGDVVVSYPRVLAQAEEYGHSPERELAYLVVHGLLHILGHDHEDAAERAIMREREEAALRPLGLSR